MDADNFAERFMRADIELLKKEGKRKIDYIPVVYPGFSVIFLSCLIKGEPYILSQGVEPK